MTGTENEDSSDVVGFFWTGTEDEDSSDVVGFFWTGTEDEASSDGVGFFWTGTEDEASSDVGFFCTVNADEDCLDVVGLCCTGPADEDCLDVVGLCCNGPEDGLLPVSATKLDLFFLTPFCFLLEQASLFFFNTSVTILAPRFPGIFLSSLQCSLGTPSRSLFTIFNASICVTEKSK